MDTQYITPQVWAEFEERFPQASAFLIGHSLIEEKRQLEKEMTKMMQPGRLFLPERFKWVEDRLATLRKYVLD